MKQFIRYFLVGGIASIIDYCFANLIYFLLDKILLGHNELLLQNISAISGIIVGLIINYFMSLKFVFKAEKRIKDFLQICLITVVSCLLTFGFTTLNVSYLKLPFAFFKIITMGTSFVWNYLARSLWVYGKNKVGKETIQHL